jgi:hypothetical protein
MTKKIDFRADCLLALDGDRYFLDERGELEVIFKVARTIVTPEVPHGLKYSLVLLNHNGDRIVGFDNAHATTAGSGPGKKRLKHYDHKHIGNKVTPYEFKDTLTLVQDFWREVDKRVQGHFRQKNL